MATLYINSCQNLQIGLWEDREWKFLEDYTSKKSSEWFHSEIYQILKKNNLKLPSLKEIVWCAGPGSYTGLRMVSGTVETLSWLGVPTYAFYAYEIGKILGYQKGIFCSFAFKGEYFIYRWDGEHESQEFANTPPSETAFWTLSEIQGVDINKQNIISTTIRKEFSKVRDWSIKSGSAPKQIFYYRPPEKEFRITQSS